MQQQGQEDLASKIVIPEESVRRMVERGEFACSKLKIPLTGPHAVLEILLWFQPNFKRFISGFPRRIVQETSDSRK